VVRAFKEQMLQVEEVPCDVERNDLSTAVGCNFAPSRIPFDKKTTFLRDITLAHYVTVCTNTIDSVR
jgi:hypothetical protein